MDALSGFALGLQAALQPANLAFCFAGVLVGTLIGVLPGIGPVGAMSLLLPATFHLSPLGAIIMLAGIYYGAQYGGSTTPHLRDLEYDPFRDLTFINRVGQFKVVVAIRADSPHKTWRDVVEWAKQNPGQLTFGHPGVATTPALAITRIAAKEGFTYRAVPFAGDGPSVSALLGGHVAILGASSVATSSYVQAKRMRILLVNDKDGLDYAPEALSFEKAGYDVESTTAVTTFGPRGMPGPVVERLVKAFNEAAKTEVFVNVARKSEVTVGAPLAGPALADWLRKVGANYEELIKAAGLYKSEKRP